jgi:mannose-6-phosphate isomerase-like protein (cupin superfamily)
MTHALTLPAETADPAHLWFGNSRVAIRVASADGADGLSVIEHWMPLGEAPPLHVHRTEDELFRILSGRFRFRVGTRVLEAGPGDTLLAPKGVPHHFRVVSPEGGHCLTVTRGADFETMVRTVSRPAARDGLPDQVVPDAAMIDALAQACAANGIDVIGAPLS